MASSSSPSECSTARSHECPPFNGFGNMFGRRDSRSDLDSGLGCAKPLNPSRTSHLQRLKVYWDVARLGRGTPLCVLALRNLRALPMSMETGRHCYIPIGILHLKEGVLSGRKDIQASIEIPFTMSSLHEISHTFGQPLTANLNSEILWQRHAPNVLRHGKARILNKHHLR